MQVDRDEPTYLQRLRQAGREGFARRIGGRWGGLTLFGPLVLGGAVGLLLAGDDPVSVSSVLVAALSGIIGVILWMFALQVWSYLNAPRDVDAAVRKQRDDALKALDKELAKVDEGLAAIGQRLHEGVLLVKRINRWPRITITEGNAMERHAAKQAVITERDIEYTQAVANWNAACAETLTNHFPSRAPLFDRPAVYSGRYGAGSIPLRVHRLREEVAQKLDRLTEYQREYEAQSRRAAIS